MSLFLGFTKHSERQYSLRAPGHLDDPIGNICKTGASWGVEI